MSQVIRISNDLYKRLESHADGFATPSSVIETILDAYEGKEPKKNHDNQEVSVSNKLDIKFYPESQKEFKNQFLEIKKAYIKLTYTDGTIKINDWNSPRFSETSSVMGNLRSGCLRNWKQKGIVMAEIALTKFSVSSDSKKD